MKKIAVGYVVGIVSALVVLLGLVLAFSQELEKEFKDMWEQKEEPELEITVYPSEDIELNHALGMNASELSDFLSQGNQQKRRSYASVFESGLRIDIVSVYDDEGPQRVQRITFDEGKVQNHLIELSSELEISMDDSSTAELSEPEIDFLNSERLLRAVQERLQSSEVSQANMERLGGDTDARPSETGISVNSSESHNNQPEN
ncbi:hypothetical protein [Puniceicoccus vermicola]|uniref:Uncharacterized protein n=1 Tax=Puniceicoccus vermicola TaxID=388746 RepID=A0A7X1AWF5_9BACT|nr:hypothetical protein [Puniceicoccus vermicola]MBC2601256.1 hypothetical protein [Puniceicoccus vermicola]